MKKYLSIAAIFTLIATIAFSAVGDKPLGVNTNQDKDLFVTVNKGGVQTEVLRVVGATGGTTVGTASTTAVHTFNVGASNRSVKVAPGTGNIRPGILADNPSQSKAVSFGAGDGIAGFMSFGGGVFEFYNDTYANVSNTSNLGLGTTVGSISAAGVWTLGPTSALKVLSDHVQVKAAGSGVGFYALSTATSTTTCNTTCETEPSGLGSVSGTCMGAWNNSTFAPISTSTVTACADASNIARRCLCAGLN